MKEVNAELHESKGRPGGNKDDRKRHVNWLCGNPPCGKFWLSVE